MAAPSFQDVQRYAKTLQRVSQKARDEFLDAAAKVDFSDWASAADELRAIVDAIVRKYGLAAAELGAQWYEFCREGEFDSRYTAIVGDTSRYNARSDANAAIDKLFGGKLTTDGLVDALAGVVANQTQKQARDTILENLQDDRLEAIRRGDRKVAARMGYARVPVGGTCAFCLMLASQGFVYSSKQSAIYKKDGGKFHQGCDCVAVPFHEAGGIPGYGERLVEYDSMYRRADNARRSGDLPDELKERIRKARDEHRRAYEAGETTDRWDPTLNENLIIMRWQNPSLH